MLQSLLSNIDEIELVVPEHGEHSQEAAVLIGISDHPVEPEILLTKRSEQLSSHRGQVSFPGGKWDHTDRDLLQTALRETHEEVGLPPEKVEVLGSLPLARTRFGISVAPFVGVFPMDVPLQANPGELEAIFKVPVSFFLADQRTRTDVFEYQDFQYWAPVWHFQGYKIWGFTASVLVDFLNRAANAGIYRSNKAPERIYS